jgi:hypothetical protein
MNVEGEDEKKMIVFGFVDVKDSNIDGDDV